MDAPERPALVRLQCAGADAAEGAEGELHEQRPPGADLVLAQGVAGWPDGWPDGP